MEVAEYWRTHTCRFARSITVAALKERFGYLSCRLRILARSLCLLRAERYSLMVL